MKKTFFLAIFLAAASSVYGQITTVTTLEDPTLQQRSSATGILNPHQVDGRFGTASMGSYLSPEPFQDRFQNSGMKFTQDGSFIGIDDSQSNIMFGSSTGSALPGESNLDLLEARQQRVYQEQFQAALQERYAQEEQRYQQEQARSASEYLTRQNPAASAASTGGNNIAGANIPYANIPSADASLQSQIPTNHPLENPLGTPEQIWMRGPAPRSVDQVTPAMQGNNIAGENGDGIDYGSRFIGGSLPNAEQANTEQANAEAMPAGAIPFNRPGPTAAETEEQLQLILLKSPLVNPLSPIQVRFNQGNVTIRGIVPADANKVEAGKILLSDPRVNAVDNQLTVLPSDPNAPLPQLFDPALQ